MVVCYSNVRRHRVVEVYLWTYSYDLRQPLAVSWLLKRDRKIWKADRSLVGLPEPLAKSRSFIPPPLWLV